jgi:hypothetical protein
MYSDDSKGWYPSIRDHRAATNQEILPTGKEWSLLGQYGWTLRTLTCPSAAFKAKFRITGSNGPLVIPYFYLAGAGDRTSSGNWFGYNDNQGYATRAPNMRPVMRASDTNLPWDTALMTDLFRGQTVLHLAGTYVRFVEATGAGSHDYMPSNHPAASDAMLRSDGTNVLTVDQVVRWKRREDTILRWTFQYHYVNW